MQTDKLIFIIISVLTVVILGGIFASSFKNDKVANLDLDVIGTNAHIKGSTNPKLTVVEFSDFECSFCAQASPVLDGLVEKYKDLALVYRHFPLSSIHPGSIPAARASEAAAMQGKFWEYHDELFANQPDFSVASLEKYATNIGLDLEKFKVDFSSSEVADKVNEDSKLANSLNLTGTPSFYIVYDGKIEKLNISSFNDVESKIVEILKTNVDTSQPQ